MLVTVLLLMMTFSPLLKSNEPVRDDAEELQPASAEQVMYVPGDLCYIGTDGVRPSNQLRLSFGVETPERLTEGMSRLARAIRAEL